MDVSAAASPDTMNYALQVALQTMKERCIELQRRLTSMEDENQKLREDVDNNKTITQAEVPLGNETSCGGAAENFQLRLQVAELQRQKAQLSEHINMVSNENRKLWSRLSQMSKEQTPAASLSRSDSQPNEDTSSQRIAISSGGVVGGANQNLIRSKTFTQHSPNPHLRQKLISDDLKDISLEEIALDADMGAGEAYANADEVELGYPYMQAESGGSELDFHMDAKRCMEGLQELRREAMKQQQELNSAFTVLESRFALQPCAECAQKAQKPEMADKSLETDESLTELKTFGNHTNMGMSTTDTTVTNGHNGRRFSNVDGGNEINTTLTSSPTTPRFNIIQEKIKADAAMVKICPMCANEFSNVSFREFQEHVETHFIGDSVEEDTIIERNFEFISHAVGDF